MSCKSSRRRLQSLAMVFSLLLPLFAQVEGSLAQGSDELGPFAKPYAYDVSIDNPAGPGTYRSLKWQVDYIPIPPNSEPVEGRKVVTDQSVYESWEYNAFAMGPHIVLVLAGTVTIESPQGLGTFSEGSGTVLEESASNSDLNQYLISNPTAQCAALLRISFYGRGDMAGLAPRASKDVPALSSDCGDEVVLFRGSGDGIKDEQVGLAIAELRSSAFVEANAAPAITMNRNTLLLVYDGFADVDMRACESCNSVTTRLFPFSSILIPAEQSIRITPHFPEDTRLLLLAVHPRDENPDLYRPTY